jgi:16S rRNA (uracil1498-N3)-methyltransferase
VPPRFFIDRPLAAGDAFALPSANARHVQVLRLQPGALITLFDGRGGEWDAAIGRIGRAEVHVRIGARRPLERELRLAVTLALGMPANERMDALVEKATELGAAAIEPLVCARSVLRLEGERAERRRAHWQQVAIAAAEQSGRTRVPRIAAVRPFAEAIDTRRDTMQWLLSLDASARPLALALAALPEAIAELRLLSGPEGGFSAEEQRLALEAGALPVGLGPRTLRADTAPLAALAALAAQFP